MNPVRSLDERYLEFVERTGVVFAQYPQLEPLRYFVFKELLTQRKGARWNEVAKHWLRPLIYRNRTTGSVRRAEALLWAEGHREVIVDALLPVNRELTSRGLGVGLVFFGNTNGLPGSTAHLQFPSRVAAPSWAKPAWDGLCDVVDNLRDKALGRSFLHMSAEVQGLFDELDRILDVIGPKVVVTASTQLIGGAGAVVASRRRGILTLLLQHGILHGLYVPMLADYMLTWGQSSNETLVRFGVSPQKLVALGSPRHDSMFPSKKSDAKARLLRPLSLPEKPTLVFFSNGNDLVRNGIAPLECARWLETTAAQYSKDINVIVRLHPNEDDSLYRGCQNLRIIKESPDLATTLHACDWVGSLCSSVLYDALLYRKPIWQFYADEWPELADNWKYDLAVRISSQSELTEMINRALCEGAGTFIDAEKAGRVFVNHGRAVQAVADFIQARLENHRIESASLHVR